MLDSFEELKREVESTQRKIDQSEGALKVLLKKMKEEFGCADLEEFDKYISNLQEEEIQVAKKVAKRTEEFRKEFQSKLEVR